MRCQTTCKGTSAAGSIQHHIMLVQKGRHVLSRLRKACVARARDEVIHIRKAIPKARIIYCVLKL